MLNWLIDFSLKHRLAVLAVAAMCVAAGAFSLSNLPLDAFPDVTDVMVQVNTVAPALSPIEVEQQISARVEQAMAGIPNLTLLRSLSKFGLSQVTLVFADGTDIHVARSQVLERLISVNLPDGVDKPTMGPIATGLGEIYHYVITVPGGNPTDARTLHDWVIKQRLLSARGVAEVNAWGGFEKQFQVVIDPMRLVKHGLSMSDILETFRRSNANVGGGGAKGAGEDLLIHGIGALSSTRDIEGITIVSRNGNPVRIGDVADVVEGNEIRRGVVTADGKGEVVLGLGFMLMGENSRTVAGNLNEKMEELRQNPRLQGTEIRVLYDRSELVDSIINTVKKNLSEGAILVVAILFLFLGHFRAALIVASAIPLSMLFAFNLMLQAGIAGTLMSLGAIDFGLVVDSSIIMIENSVRRLRDDSTNRSAIEVVSQAAKEVRKPTMFGEIIIMIVYLPILALYGVEGKLFRPMALTVIFALLGSLLLSLTVMPVLASYFLSHGSTRREEPWIVILLKKMYRPLVRFAVDHRLLIIGSALIVVLGTIPVAFKLGSIFVPELDEGAIVINTVRFPGVSIDESARVGTMIERLLKSEFPDEIKSIWTRTGTPEVATDPMGIEVSDIFIMLTPRESWKRAGTKRELEKAMDQLLRPLPGMSYAFTQPIEMRFNEMIAGIRTDVGVKIFGDNLDALKEKSAKIEALLRTVPGASNPSTEPLVGRPVLQVKPDLDSLSRHGLRVRDVLDIVEAAGGTVVGEVRCDQMRFPLALKLADRYTSNPDLMGTLLVPAPGGERIPLSSLAMIERVNGPLAIKREWGKRSATVTTNVVDRDLGGFVAEAKNRIESELGDELRAAGIERIEFGGQYENLARASKTLSWVVPLAIFLILILVYSTYGNVADSLRVFTGVPFAMVGGVFALYLRDMPFSISAGVGFIALSGVSVLADMVMVTTIRQFMEAGVEVRSAALRAAEQRLRPVLMTALVAGLGFIPMAMNTGIGAEVQRPLATVVIGGLLSSTFLTLIVLPTLYVAIKSPSDRRPSCGQEASRPQ